MKNIREELLRHKKELITSLRRFGYRMVGKILVVNRMELALSGTLKARLLQHPEVARSILMGDREREQYYREWVRNAMTLRLNVPFDEVGCYSVANTWFNEGITKLLGLLGYETQQQYHYFLIGINDVTPVAGWTLSSSGTKIRTTFGEFTAYDEAARVTWQDDTAAAKAITNSTEATITCNNTGTLRGACLVSKSPKDGSTDETGYAIAGQRFSTDIPAANTNVIKIQHTLQGDQSP